MKYLIALILLSAASISASALLTIENFQRLCASTNDRDYCAVSKRFTKTEQLECTADSSELCVPMARMAMENGDLSLATKLAKWGCNNAAPRACSLEKHFERVADYNKNRSKTQAKMTNYQRSADGGETARFEMPKPSSPPDKTPSGCDRWDLGEALQDSRFVPNIVPGTGGKQKGFRMVKLEPQSYFDRLGLKANDIILKIDGLDMSESYKRLAFENHSSVKISIERGGKVQTIIVHCPRKK